MLPLMLVALLMWACVFTFVFFVDTRVRAIEKIVLARRNRPEDRS